MWLRLILATIGVSGIRYLLFYILRVGRGLKIDWDGIIERIFIVFLISGGGIFIWLIPLVVLTRVFYYLGIRSRIWFTAGHEPAMEFQKINFKTEMLLDLSLSPALSILICLII